MEKTSTKIWCENQFVDENGIIACSAHIAEDRVFMCPYKDNEDRKKREYPCSDYRAPKSHG